MKKTIALLVTLDTKDQEAAFLQQEIEANGHEALLIDIGVIGKPGIKAAITRGKVISTGGGSIKELLKNPTREKSNPFVVQGCIKILNRKIVKDEVHDMSGFVGIKDITMMFSVSDILKLNPFTRKILANAAAAACGMAQVTTKFIMEKGDKPLIGMSNLGVLTKGSMEAIQYIQERGYEVIVFHAVGSGGQAMEQMMKEGIIGAVFDYAMGEIADDVWGVLRAGGPERLTVAGKLGLPQVLCPGGAEHLGILVPPNQVPKEWKNHKIVFHSPVVFVPRLFVNVCSIPKTKPIL